MYFAVLKHRISKQIHSSASGLCGHFFFGTVSGAYTWTCELVPSWPCKSSERVLQKMWMCLLCCVFLTDYI